MTGYVPRKSREVHAERFATLREAIEAGPPRFANGGIVAECVCEEPCRYCHCEDPT